MWNFGDSPTGPGHLNAISIACTLSARVSHNVSWYQTANHCWLSDFFFKQSGWGIFKSWPTFKKLINVVTKCEGTAVLILCQRCHGSVIQQ